MIVSRLTLPINMVLHRLSRKVAVNPCSLNILHRRVSDVYFRSGAVKPKPGEMPLGLLAIFCAVIPGLYVGATISKNVVYFIEEYDFFYEYDDDY